MEEGWHKGWKDTRCVNVILVTPQSQKLRCSMRKGHRVQGIGSLGVFVPHVGVGGVTAGKWVA
eukprot:14499042-Ditylum_brightwellii.AAC.1